MHLGNLMQQNTAIIRQVTLEREMLIASIQLNLQLHLSWVGLPQHGHVQ